MANIVFEHILPDETYNNTGHPFNGMNKRILYAMGMLYNTEEINALNPQSIEEYEDYIIDHLSQAKTAYAEVLNDMAKRHIQNNLNSFLKKIYDYETDVNITTQE